MNPAFFFYLYKPRKVTAFGQRLKSTYDNNNMWNSIKSHTRLFTSRRTCGSERVLPSSNSIVRHGGKQWQYSINSHIPFSEFTITISHFVTVLGLLGPSSRIRHHLTSMCHLNTLKPSCNIHPASLLLFDLSVKSKDGFLCLSPLMPSLLFSPSLFLSFTPHLHPSPWLALSGNRCKMLYKKKKKTQYSSPCFARGVPFSYGLAILPARISPYPSRLTLFFISTFLKSN